MGPCTDVALHVGGCRRVQEAKLLKQCKHALPIPNVMLCALGDSSRAHKCGWKLDRLWFCMVSLRPPGTSPTGKESMPTCIRAGEGVFRNTRNAT